jgi:hypothetical protein
MQLKKAKMGLRILTPNRKNSEILSYEELVEGLKIFRKTKYSLQMFYQKVNYFTNKNFFHFQMIKNGGLD